MRKKLALVIASAIATTIMWGCFDFGGLEGDGSSSCADCDGGGGDGTSGESGALGFSLSAAGPVMVQQGSNASVDVVLTRTGGFSDAVNVSITGLPSAVTANALIFAANATKATVTFAADESSPQSLSHLKLDGLSTDGKLSASTNLDVIVRGLPGSLDLLFGDNGIVTGFAPNSSAGPVALDSSGNILVSGSGPSSSFEVARVTPDGKPDSTFGTKGVLQTTFASTAYFPGLFPLPSGAVLVTGQLGTGPSASYVFVLVTKDGAIDSGFSPDGGLVREIVTGGTTLLTYAMDSLTNVVAGGYDDITTPIPIYITRRTSQGDFDPAFSSSSPDLGNGDGQINALAIESDGSLVVAATNTNSGITGTALVRIKSNGDYDNAFANFGYAAPTTTTQGTTPGFVGIQSDGKIVVVGLLASSQNIFRFTTAGAIDTAFGTSGVVSSSLGGEGMAIQKDDKIVLAGTAISGMYDAISIGRLTPSGGLDTTFGNGGTVVTPVGTANTDSSNIVIQPDGRIVVAATSAASGMVIARYWP